MRFSFKELESYFKDSLPSVPEVVDLLTDHAFEVDEVLEKSGGDFELDIKVLPDRAGDAKDPLGMAREISSITECALKDEYISETSADNCRAKIDFTVDNINNLVGVDFTKEQIVDFLSRVRVKAEDIDDHLVAFIPAERTDLNIKEDLADEVARLFGYANVESKELEEVEDEVEHAIDFVLANQLRRFFVENGFTEIYGYTFRSQGVVEVEKPLASDKAFLRTDLSSGMSEYVNKNLGFVLFDDTPVKIFEIGSVFEALNREEKRLCVAIGHTNAKLHKTNNLIDEIRGKIASDFTAEENDFVITNLENKTIIEIPLSKLKPKAEKINLKDFLKTDNYYKPFSVYPRIVRDIAVLVPEEVSAQSVAGTIGEAISNNLAVGPVLFDEFKKDQKVSYAFRMVFQSDQTTLTDQEVGEQMNRVEEMLKNQGYEIR